MRSETGAAPGAGSCMKWSSAITDMTWWFDTTQWLQSPLFTLLLLLEAFLFDLFSFLAFEFLETFETFDETEATESFRLTFLFFVARPDFDVFELYLVKILF